MINFEGIKMVVIKKSIISGFHVVVNGEWDSFHSSIRRVWKTANGIERSIANGWI